MIASRTIQHNGDRTYDILFILLSHNEEVSGQRSGQSQRLGQRIKLLMCVDVVVWRHPRANVVVRETKQACGAHGKHVKSLFLACVRDGRCMAARAHEAETSADAWRRVWGVFWQFFIGFCLGSEDLSICALTLAVWSTKLTKSECFRGCGRDDDDSLLIVTTGWRRG